MRSSVVPVLLLVCACGSRAQPSASIGSTAPEPVPPPAWIVLEEPAPLDAKLIEVEELKYDVILHYDRGTNDGVMVGWWAFMTDDGVSTTRRRIARVTADTCATERDDAAEVRKLIAMGFETARLEAPFSEDPEHPGTLLFCGQAYEANVNEITCAGADVTSLTPLEGMTTVRSITLDHTAVTDLRPLQALPLLTWLTVAGAPLSDLGPVAGMSALESLDVNGSRVTDLSPLAGHATLRSLDLTGTAVIDLTPLRDAPALRYLDLEDTQISDADVAALQAARPGLEVYR